MNREDIIRMAREAGFDYFDVVLTANDPSEEPMAKALQKDLVDCGFRFASLVAAAEREACAKVCEEQAVWFDENRNFADASGAESCAAAIRARGDKP
jgi:predicted aldo/keto reductase-like oxidoreductase